MKKQEVVSIVSELPSDISLHKGPLLLTYPILDEMLEKGMYIESLTQTPFANNMYLITFVFRHYNDVSSNTQY